MTVQIAFANWSTSGLDWLKAPYNACSPNLVVIGAELDKRWPGGQNLGCHVDRTIRDGESISAHAYGAARDWRYPAGSKDAVIRWLIDNSAELGVQAIHDYAGCRIWRAGRTTDVADAHGAWWKAQAPNTANGMGQAWADYLHVETHPARFGDTTPIDQRLAPPAPPTTPEPHMANIAIIRPRGIADQFALVPIASVEQARRMGIDGQAPVVVDVDRAALEAQVGYQLTPTQSGQ